MNLNHADYYRNDGVSVSRTPDRLVIDRNANQQGINSNYMMAGILMIFAVTVGLLIGTSLFGAFLFGVTGVGLGFLKVKFSMDRNQIDRICFVRGQGFEIRREGVFFTHQPEPGGDLSTISSVFCTSTWEGGGREGPRVQVWKVMNQLPRCKQRGMDSQIFLRIH